MEQGTPEWLEMRKNYLGASDAPIVMKVSPWSTPFQLWRKKLGLVEDEPENDNIRYGKAMEPIARKAYEKHTNNLVTPEIIFHPEKKFMMASLDGLSLNGDIIVEIKTANKNDHQLAKEGKIPKKYFPQLQHQLDCLPGAVLHYWSYHKDEGVLVEVERDDEYIERLVSEEERFWKCVQDFEAPPLTSADYVEFSNDTEWLSLINEAREVDELEKALKERKERNRNALKNKAGGQSALGNGAKFTKIVKPGLIDWKALCEERSISRDEQEQFRKSPVEQWRLSLS